jgi:hypothetical protein
MSRSAVYAGLTASLIAIFAGTQKFVETLGERYFEGEIGATAGASSGWLETCLIAKLIQPGTATAQ